MPVARPPYANNVVLNSLDLHIHVRMGLQHDILDFPTRALNL